MENKVLDSLISAARAGVVFGRQGGGLLTKRYVTSNVFEVVTIIIQSLKANLCSQFYNENDCFADLNRARLNQLLIIFRLWCIEPQMFHMRFFIFSH